MSYFVLLQDADDGSLRLLSPSVVPTRREALEAVSTALRDDPSLRAAEVFVAELASASPVLIVDSAPASADVVVVESAVWEVEAPAAQVEITAEELTPEALVAPGVVVFDYAEYEIQVAPVEEPAEAPAAEPATGATVEPEAAEEAEAAPEQEPVSELLADVEPGAIEDLGPEVAPESETEELTSPVGLDVETVEEEAEVEAVVETEATLEEEPNEVPVDTGFDIEAGYPVGVAAAASSLMGDEFALDQQTGGEPEAEEERTAPEEPAALEEPPAPEEMAVLEEPAVLDEPPGLEEPASPEVWAVEAARDMAASAPEEFAEPAAERPDTSWPAETTAEDAQVLAAIASLDAPPEDAGAAAEPAADAPNPWLWPQFKEAPGEEGADETAAAPADAIPEDAVVESAIAPEPQDEPPSVEESLAAETAPAWPAAEELEGGGPLPEAEAGAPPSESQWAAPEPTESEAAVEPTGAEVAPGPTAPEVAPEPPAEITVPVAPAYEPGGDLDMSQYTCDDCVYMNTCPKVGQSMPAECGSFQWRSS